MIGIQQISDRMRAAPTQAVRAVFAGIGRILLTADRPESRPAAVHSRSTDQANGSPSERAEPSQTAARRRDLDKTGNVRLLSAEEMILEFGIDGAGRTAAGSPTGGRAEPGPGTMAATVPTVELPLTGYDLLSLASLRARLRNLDIDQLRVLAEYERTHAERPEVLGMFERRIEKLGAAG
jgi:hypothetical protein